MIARSVFTLMLLLSTYLSYSQGYKIDLKIKGVSDTVVYLGNYYEDKQYAIDTFKVSNNGEVIMQGDSALHQGIYLILFPSLKMKYFEVLIGDDQHFSMTTDTLNFTEHMKVKGSKENEAFYEFHNFMIDQSKKNMPLKRRLDALPKEADSTKIIRDILVKNEKAIKQKWKDLSVEWKGHLFGAIMKAMIEPELPEVKVPDNIANKDSVKRIQNYLNYKKHYFDNIDLQDNRLIRTPFLYSKVDKFMRSVVVQYPDSVLKEGEKLIEAARGADDIFAFLVRYMFSFREKTKLMAMDKVFVEISEKYYLSGQATWTDSSFLAKVKERVVKEKPNLIGNQAPPLRKLQTYEKQYVSLSDIQNKYTIIIFWEPNCGHCKKAVPKLYKEYQQMKKDDIDVEVLALYIQFEREPWEKFIEEKELFDWINAYDKNYFSNFRNTYDIASTPIIYLLDKNKKIIAKRLGVDQVQQIIYDLEGNKLPTAEKKEEKKK